MASTGKRYNEEFKKDILRLINETVPYPALSRILGLQSKRCATGCKRAKTGKILQKQE